ncbi:hypothetical protein MDAP_002294 [Mitosporidium daphniae]|uniref:Uncharacterized protein n=1 Tax=Mitosporidium daphniae TaxID=1485682 RepID=A0A098VPR7_9MICR|nr:uncharacterized protein DI09_46p20 [Mitosporidium daphniae]KGG51052.1 hypothetical protein DI09_46p20 [Mitosporidium daphniae]|eukprot:XP_013237498.1 uncharacterized protein DI09_46p20 [Mitosporidium daphniae]
MSSSLLCPLLMSRLPCPSIFQSILAARHLQTRGFKRNIKARTNKPVTSNISKTPNAPNLFEGAPLILDDGSQFVCIDTLQLSLKSPLLKQLMPDIPIPDIGQEPLPPLTRTPKSHAPFRALSEEEHSRLLTLRQKDPQKYSVSECAKLFNCPPLQIMQTVHAPANYKKELAAQLDKQKYRRRNVIRARRKEVFENAWHHYHS